MPRYNPRTRVFHYGGVTEKLKRERHVLREFCKRLQRRHQASYKVIPLAKAIHQGLIAHVDGSTVDGVLRTSQGPVAVELLGYSPVMDRGDVMSRDTAFRKKSKRSLYDRLKAKNFSLSFSYREKRRPGPKYAMIRTVPTDRTFELVLEELRSIVAIVPTLGFNEFLSVRFIKPDIAERWGRRRGTLYLDETRFPVCAAHFDLLRFQGLTELLIPQVGSDLSGGFIGLDEEWVRQHVASKARKSANRSFVRANGLPLWLIVHSDGYAIHQMIPWPLRRRAVELCREVLALNDHRFARVYWADRTGYLDAAWVGRVV